MCHSLHGQGPLAASLHAKRGRERIVRGTPEKKQCPTSILCLVNVAAQPLSAEQSLVAKPMDNSLVKTCICS